MRRALTVVTILAGCATPPPDSGGGEVGDRYVSIGGDAVATAREVIGMQLEVLEADAEIAVIAVPARDLDALSARLHERHHRCGGFMVHESLDEARATLRASDRDRPPIDYTLDRDASVRAVLPTLEPSSILGTIGELSAMPNRYYRSASGAAASRWLRDRWRSFTTRAEVTVELFDHGYPQQSVILTIPGSTHANEVVVIGGHLDSIARGGTASTAPGADDDASGIATLTEVARALLAADYRPARTLQLIAYAAEEVGLRGSLGIARAYRKRNIDVVGVMQLDMTNYQGSDKDIWLMKDYTDAAQNAFVIRLIDRYVGATWGVDACGYACSDHAAWTRAGVPASMPFESRMSQHNPAIHTREDTLERSHHNAAHAIKFARLAAAFAIELGKGELGPSAAPATRPTSGGTGGPPPEAPDPPPHRSPWLALALAVASLMIARRLI